MADTYTTNLNLTKPEPGAAEDTWGISLNSDLDVLDAIFSSSGTQVNLNPNQVNFADSKKAIFGTGGDLEIYHDGTNTYLKNNTGDLNLRQNANDKDVLIQSDNGSGGLSTYFRADGSTGETKLYNYGALKLSTKSDGIDVSGVTGTTFGVNIIDPSATAYGGHFSFDDANSKILIGGVTNGTKNTAISIPRDSTQVDFQSHITLPDDARIKLGNSSDLQIYHDGSNSYIKEAGIGNLQIQATGSTFIKSSDGTKISAQFAPDSYTRLYYNNANKLETTSTGIDVSGRLDVAQDLRLRGNSSTSDVGVASISIADAAGSINFDAGNNGTNMSLTSTGLDVTGNIEVGDSHLIGSDSFDNLALISSSGENIVVGANNDIYFTTGATSLSSTGTTKLIVKDNGNIGIGTTAPTEKLHVEGNIELRNGGHIGSLDGNYWQRIRFEDDTPAATNAFNFETRNGSGSFINHMTITNNGDVGIGDTTPDAKLTVQGDVLARDEFRGEVVNYASNQDAPYLIASTTGYTGATTNWNTYGFQHRIKTDSNGVPRITIDTHSGEVFAVTNNNRVGIGISAATSPLHVYNATVDTVANFESGDASVAVNFTASDNSMQIATSGTDGIIKNNGAGNFRLFNNGSERARINSSGNVGIGETAPSDLLHINKSQNAGTQIQIENQNTGTSSYAGLNLNGQGNNLTIKNWGDGTSKANATEFISTASGSHFIFSTQSTERARIDNGGRLLVGTTSIAPYASTSDTAQGIALRGDFGMLGASRPNNYALSLNRAESDGDIVNFRKSGLTVGSIGTNSGYIRIGTGDTHLLYHSGIDTIIPYSGSANRDNAISLGYSGARFKDLHLSGTANVGGISANSGTTDLVATFQSSDQFADIKLQDSGGSSFIRQSNGSLIFEADRDNAVSSSALVFQIDGSNVGRFTSNGRLGIGTTAPNNKLTVSGASDGINIVGTNSFVRWNSGNMMIRDEGSYAMGFHTYDGSTGQVERMRITSAGEVLVGTTNATTPSTNAKKVVVGSTTNGDRVAYGLNVIDGATNYRTELFLDDSNATYGLKSAASAGNVAFTISQGSTEQLRVDTSGNLLVGKTSGDFGATVGVEIRGTGNSYFTANNGNALRLNRTGTDGEILTLRKDNGTVGFLRSYAGTRLSIGSNGASGVIFGTTDILPATSGTTAVNNTYNLGSSSYKFKDLRLGGRAYVGTIEVDAPADQGVKISSSSPYLFFNDTDTANVYDSSISQSGATLNIGGATPAQTLKFRNKASFNESGRIDTNGNLLIGTTAADIVGSSTATGINLNPNSASSFNRSGGAPLFVNRIGSDGTLLQFRKSGSTVGSIGTTGGDLLIGTDDCAIRFSDGADQIRVCTTSGTNRDGAIDLGFSDSRFKDLHLSGNANLGSSNFLRFTAATSGSDASVLFGNSAGTGGSLTFKRNSDSAALAKINGTGQLLVTPLGVTTPSFAFTNDTNTGMTRPTSDTLQFVTAGSEKVRITEDGKVGIGISSPPDILTITGYAKYIASYNGSKYAFKLGADSSGDGNFMLHDGVNGAVKVKLYAESGSANYINNGGNFGVGRTDPTHRLDVKGTGSTLARFLADSSNDDALVRIIGGNYGTEKDARLFLGEGDTYGMTVEYDGLANIGYLGMNNNVDPTGAYSKRMQMSRGGTEVSFMAGNVGIGNTNPAHKLYVDSGTTNVAAGFKSSDAGSYVGFEDNTTGNTGSNSNVLIGANGNNFVIFTGAAEKARITSDGKFYVGTTTGQTANSHITTKAAVSGDVFLNGVRFNTNTSEGAQSVSNAKLWMDSTDLYIGSTLIETGATSDIRLKENIENIPNAIEKVKLLNGVTFNYKKKPDVKEAGFIAQDVQKALPEAVYTAYEDDEEVLALRYNRITSVLVEAIKEQQEQIESLKSEIANLKGE